MKNNKLFIPVITLLFSLASCNNAKKTESSEVGHDHNMSTMKDSSMNDTSMKMDEHQGHDMAEVHTVDLGEVDLSVKKQLSNLLSSYYTIKNALVTDDAKTAKVKASDFLKSIEKVDTDKMTGEQKKLYEMHIEKTKFDAEHISETDKIDHQREHFAALSKNVFTIVKNFKASNSKVYYDHCPMAFNNKGADWISEKEEISNPYMGNAMPTCGSTKESF